jgi:hypothetical protein
MFFNKSNQEIKMILLDAVLTGASMFAGGAMTNAGKEAYTKMIEILRDRFTQQLPSAEAAEAGRLLEQAPNDPDARQNLTAAIYRTRADQEPQLEELAKQVLAPQSQYTGAMQSTVVVHGNVGKQHNYHQPSGFSITFNEGKE